MPKIKSSFSLLFLVIFFSCRTSYEARQLQYKDYRITRANVADGTLKALLQPYADSVNKSMNDVIAVADVKLEKKQPEGSLGNFMADAMLEKAKEKYQAQVDLSVMNFGGIRLPMLPAGNITRGKVFELSPFDNIIVLLRLDATLLQVFFNHIASKGGWPVSGISYQIKNKQAVNISIAGTPLNQDKTYTMAILDYVANGGDDATMLRKIPQVNHGYLFRDALIEYVSEINSAGRKISAKIENRVSYAD